MARRYMYLIGLTGNIATGKSSVARILQGLGAHVVDADKLAHRLMEPGTEVWQQVVDAFGEEMVGPGDRIDRSRLGALVFSDPKALRRLEEIVHPAVLTETERILMGIEQAHDPEESGLQQGEEVPGPVAVVEAIKLIESGLAERCDSVWVVTCARDLQVQRLMENRGLSRAEVLLRIEAQPSQEQKVELADVVIENDGSREDLRERVEREWERLQALLSSSDNLT
ncbi:MAG: dephospho-CoA kinase [Anaerolineae bacterium]|nr:dephospho-CoA kinase [Anaerolineae bacterium]